MKKIIILIPVFNDWQSLNKLLENINLNLSKLNFNISLIVVNDASNEKNTNDLNKFENIKSIKTINLIKNIGHARSIATGLKHIFEKEEFDYVIPMDGDGEDRPEELKNFIEVSEQVGDKSIVGERVKRSEGLLFQICYNFHKFLTLAFTGQSIKFGNYSCLSKITIEKMLKEKATWSSFSGSLRKVE